MITVDDLNTMADKDALAWFEQTCTAQRWCQLMVAGRPYQSIRAVEHSAKHYWSTMRENDYIQAFKGHPLIGDLSSLRAKYNNTKALASNEQSGTSEASEQVLLALKHYNHDYLDKHGFIFIICASGLSAKSMLDALQSRIHNSTQTELENAAKEQLKITLLRIKKALKKLC